MRPAGGRRHVRTDDRLLSAAGGGWSMGRSDARSERQGAGPGSWDPNHRLMIQAPGTFQVLTILWDRL